MKETENQLVLPIPEPKDLPPYYVFDGWHRAKDGRGFYAWVRREHPLWPPQGAQIALGFVEMQDLKPKARVKYAIERITAAIDSIEQTARALHWDDDHGAEWVKQRAALKREAELSMQGFS